MIAWQATELIGFDADLSAENLLEGLVTRYTRAMRCPGLTSSTVLLWQEAAVLSAGGPGGRRSSMAARAGSCASEQCSPAASDGFFDSQLRRAGENMTLDSGLPTSCPADTTSCVFRCLEAGFRVEVQQPSHPAQAPTLLHHQTALRSLSHQANISPWNLQLNSLAETSKAHPESPNPASRDQEHALTLFYG
eukprot:3432014-Rhodomonas_salina.3